jgi:hypothetical protein
MHPAKDGFAALPFFDEFDLSTVDVLLLSQYVVTPLSSRSDRILSSFEKRMSKRVGFVAATSAALNDSEGILPPRAIRKLGSCTSENQCKSLLPSNFSTAYKSYSIITDNGGIHLFCCLSCIFSEYTNVRGILWLILGLASE